MNQKAMDFYASGNWEACYRCLPQMAQKILFLIKDEPTSSNRIYQELHEANNGPSSYLSRLVKCGIAKCDDCFGLKYSIVNEDFAAYVARLGEVPLSPDEAAKQMHDQVFSAAERLFIKLELDGLVNGYRVDHAEKVAQYAGEVVLENWKDA